MKHLLNSGLNLTTLIFFLAFSLSTGAACKGCDSESDTPVSADAKADTTTDAIKKPRRKRKPRTRVEAQKAPPRRRAKRTVDEEKIRENTVLRYVPRDAGNEKPDGETKPTSVKQQVREHRAIKERQAKKRILSENALIVAEAKEKRNRQAARPVDTATVSPDIVRVQALQIQKFVQTTELVQTLNQANGMVEAPLLGQDITADYNHFRLIPVGQKGALGLVIQVWRDESVPSARKRHEEFLNSYPSAKANQSVTRKTFFAQYGERSYVGFLATGQRTNVVLTCKAALCTPEQLHKIAVGIKKRLVSQ
jgi:hypothetical protein